MAATSRITIPDLEDVSTRILAAAGLPEDQARIVSQVLVFADARRVWSHGVFRLDSYVGRILAGGVNTNPQVSIETLAPSLLRVWGDHGMGHVVTMRATEAAMAAARATGIALAAVTGSGHFGMASAYSRRAAEEGFIGIVWTTTSATLAPWGSKEPLLGNNPIAFSLPVQGGWPITLDMALSTVAGGKIHIAAQRGEPIPLGWALDSEGNETTDAKAALAGTLFPIGGYKGSGLSIVTEMMAAGLTRGQFAFQAPDLWRNPGEKQSSSHILLVVDVERFLPLDEFSAWIGQLAERVRGSARRPGFDRVFLPGEPEEEDAAEAQRHGIDLPDTSRQAVRKAAAKAGIDCDL